MDKETLSQYGWVIIVIIVLAIMIGLATPFGNFVSNSVKNSSIAFGDKIAEVLDGYENNTDAFDDIGGGSSTPKAHHMISVDNHLVTCSHAYYANQKGVDPEDCFYSFFVLYYLGEELPEAEAETLVKQLQTSLDEPSDTEGIIYTMTYLSYDKYYEYVNAVDLSNVNMPDEFYGLAPDATKVVFENKLPDDSVEVYDYTDPLYANKGEKVVAWVDADNTLHIAANGKIVAPVNSYGLFFDLTKVKTFEFNGVFDTSEVVNATLLFKCCYALESIDLSELDFTNTVTMDQLLFGCSSLKEIDFRSVKAPKVTNINSIFEQCTSLTTIDLRGFDASSITILGRVFLHDDALETIRISDSFDLRNVEEFDLSVPTTAKVIFEGDYATFTELANGKFDAGVTVECTDGTFVIE